MTTFVCPNCGEHVSPTESVCPACGARPHPAGSPERWSARPVRRAALVAGIVIALLIVAALTWMIVTGRRSLLEPISPIFPSGVVAPVQG